MHLCVLILDLDFGGFLLLHFDYPLNLLPFLSIDLVLLSDKLNLSLFELHTRHFSPADLRHLIVVLSNGVQILGDYGCFVESAGGSYFSQVRLVV